MNSKRQLNLELLRIVAMIMIVMLHFLGSGHGDVINKVDEGSILWAAAWILEAFCCVAVNCYILISGYFLSQIDPQKRKIKNICIEIWFYSLLFLIICFIKGNELHLEDIKNYIIPITNRTYWFATTYIGLYLLAPYLNVMIKNMTSTQYKSLLLIMLFMFSIVATFYPFIDTFSLGGGQGILWMITVYLTGGYIRREAEAFRFSKRKWGGLYLLSSVMIAGSKFLISFVTTRLLGHTEGTSIFYTYNSPLCFFSSFCLFNFFRMMNISERRINHIIYKLSSTTFGVYLLHDAPFSRSLLGHIRIDSTWGLVSFLLYSILITVSVFVICSIVDLLRQIIFVQIKNVYVRMKGMIKNAIS